LDQHRSNSWVVIFLCLSAIWGSSFLFIKVADRALSPPEVTLARVAVGAAVLLGVLAAGRRRLPRSRAVWAHLCLLGLVGNVLPFTLIAYGETRISSVLAGIWNATTPLMTLLVVMVILREERPTREAATGLLIGFAVVVCVLGPWTGVGGGALDGDLACLGAATLYGVAIPYTRRFLSPLGLPPTTLAAGQLLCASVELALAMPLIAKRPGVISPAVVLSALALGALGTGLAFALVHRLIGLAGATTASSVTYLIPLFATALGILVLGERLHWYEPLGAVVVLAGVAVSQRRLTLPGGGRRTGAASPLVTPAPAGGPVPETEIAGNSPPGA
jgi:drug/metabolite transporter (DMT)-like permease